MSVTPQTASFVYFIQAAEGGPVKIGRAIDPEKRRRELQTGHPYKLVIRRVIDGGAETELQLHGRFDTQRLEGEWFECSGLLAETVAGREIDWWVDICPPPPGPKCQRCKGEIGDFESNVLCRPCNKKWVDKIYRDRRDKS